MVLPARASKGFRPPAANHSSVLTTKRRMCHLASSASGRITGSIVIACSWCLLALAADGCAHVPAYEREKLAHPTMTTDDLARPSEDHVRAVQEGAVGGGDATGGGCGCN